MVFFSARLGLFQGKSHSFTENVFLKNEWRWRPIIENIGRWVMTRVGANYKYRVYSLHSNPGHVQLTNDITGNCVFQLQTREDPGCKMVNSFPICDFITLKIEKLHVKTKTGQQDWYFKLIFPYRSIYGQSISLILISGDWAPGITKRKKILGKISCS